MLETPQLEDEVLSMQELNPVNGQSRGMRHAAFPQRMHLGRRWSPTGAYWGIRGHTDLFFA